MRVVKYEPLEETEWQIFVTSSAFDQERKYAVHTTFLGVEQSRHECMHCSTGMSMVWTHLLPDQERKYAEVSMYLLGTSISCINT